MIISPISEENRMMVYRKAKLSYHNCRKPFPPVVPCELRVFSEDDDVDISGEE